MKLRPPLSPPLRHADALESARARVDPALPDVVTLSLALDARDVHGAAGPPALACMEFGRAPPRAPPAAAVEAVEDVVALAHGTVVRFDARRDARARRQHRVPCTLRRRLSLTLRRVLAKTARAPDRLDIAAAIAADRRPFT